MSDGASPWPEPDTDRSNHLREFLERHELRPQRLAPFDQALTHSSYAFENHLPGDNERLEFLGDSLIGLVTACWLFETAPGAQEGELSKRKAALVNRAVLGRRAKALDIGAILRVGRGEVHSGARHRSSVLGSALEALVGAVYWELGLDSARLFVLDHVVQPSLDESGGVDFVDFKSVFQELVQKRLRAAPQYETISETGPDHDRRFVVRALIEGQEYGRGEGRRKKTAEAQAAQMACQRFLAEIQAENDQAERREPGPDP